MSGAADDTREVAHDLNNLLTAVIGASDSILERSDTDTETRADVAHIREGARRGAALVRRLLGEAGDLPKPVAINDTIRATCRLLSHQPGSATTLTLDLAERRDWAMVDPAQLDRVLLNLVANARHAMPAGGTVILATAHQTIEATRAGVPDHIPPGDYVVITITDGGIGISPERITRIFDAGYTSRAEAGGSGLGLASVRDIVHGAGGFLAVESTEGTGTRVEVWLPRIASPPIPAVPEPPPTVPGRTVLLVEDDLLVRRVAERALRRAGWTVLCADSAEHALEIMQHSDCDLMISDVAMPGMDGVALTRLVLARQPGLPVILTSGYGHDVADAGLAVVNVAFLTKPYGQKELLGAVARFAGG